MIKSVRLLTLLVLCFFITCREVSLHADDESVTHEHHQELSNDSLDQSLSAKKTRLVSITSEEFIFKDIPDYIVANAKRKFLQERAIVLYEYYIREFPDGEFYSKALYNVANHYFLKKNYTEAMSHYKDYIKAEGIEGHTQQARFNVGMCLMEANQFEEAIPIFNQVLDYYTLSDLHFPAYKQIAECYSKLNDDKRRIMTYENAAGFFTDPNIRAECYIRIADAMMNKKQYYDAVWYLKQVSERFKQSKFYFESLFLMGECYEFSGELKQAQASYQQIVQDHSYDNDFQEKALYALGYSLYKEENYKDASITLYTAIKKYPSYSGLNDALFKLAECYMQLSLPDLAYDIYTELSNKRLHFKRKNTILFRLGELNYKRKDYSSAIEVFQRIKLINDKTMDDQITFYVGMSHYYMEEHRSAFEKFLHLKHQAADTQIVVESLYMLGRILIDVGKFESAVPYFEECIANVNSIIENKNTEVSDQPTETVITPETIAFFRSIKQKALYALGNAFFKHEMYSNAAQYYQQIDNYELSSHDRAWLLYNIGKCYEHTRDYDNSKVYYNKVVTLYPEIDIAQQAAWDLKNIQWKDRFSK
ncbi:MAG: hypothetical protein C4541_02450 [Candidatus Auribacter fodinae]|jgi:TolA-binding protein|uniref:Tetratricopeptide repeat protein n=1 Tax=Candidatus Auribacter fodinae TaxID=2093366 RepID=A0A3A4RHY7_9BACT|nr:MAG: hypothetical protein C4541_02450 [Candidatus Auribacter fodinae]